MNWLDILIIVCLVASAIGGLKTGIIRGLSGFLGLILGIFLAGLWYERVGGWLGFIHNESIANVIAFILVLVVVMAVIGLLGSLLHKIASSIMLGWLDHVIGGILGLLIGAVAWGAFLALWVKFFSNGIVGDSWLAEFLLDKFPLVLALLPASFDSVRNFFG
jgi:membrane protein required for colicin V production